MNKLKTLLLTLSVCLLPLKSNAQDKKVMFKTGLSSSHQMHNELASYYPSLGLILGVDHMLTKNLAFEYSIGKEIASSFDRESSIVLTETNLGVNFKSNKEEKAGIYFGLGGKLNNIYEKKELSELGANYFGGYLKAGLSWKLNENAISYLEAEYSLTHAHKYPVPGISNQIKVTLGLGFK